MDDDTLSSVHPPTTGPGRRLHPAPRHCRCPCLGGIGGGHHCGGRAEQKSPPSRRSAPYLPLGGVTVLPVGPSSTNLGACIQAFPVGASSEAKAIWGGQRRLSGVGGGHHADRREWEPGRCPRDPVAIGRRHTVPPRSPEGHRLHRSSSVTGPIVGDHPVDLCGRSHHSFGQSSGSGGVTTQQSGQRPCQCVRLLRSALHLPASS